MSADEWKTSACILCECNCGIKVQTGGNEGREIVRIRGDEDHPASQGYLCQKASGLNHYQNGKDRITQPLRRRRDGSFEEIDWETATREIMERFSDVRDTHGGDKIFYYGGGGQGNHLPGAIPAQRDLSRKHLSIERLGAGKDRRVLVGQMFDGQVTSTTAMSLFSGENPGYARIPRAEPS